MYETDEKSPYCVNTSQETQFRIVTDYNREKSTDMINELNAH